jgi:hypothetical protein
MPFAHAPKSTETVTPDVPLQAPDVLAIVAAVSNS